MSYETYNLFKDALAQGRQINQLCIKWQHEIFESMGIARAFGVSQLEKIHINFPSDKSMPLHLQQFAQICQMSVVKAMKIPRARAGKDRRFKPAPKLVAKGRLNRVTIARIFAECCNKLLTVKSVRLLREARAKGENINTLCILWQREIIEGMGFEQEFGVNTLMLVPIYNSGDQQLLMAMQRFQSICMSVVKQALEPDMSANADFSKRIYKPKEGKLVDSGIVPRRKLFEFFKAAKKLNSPEVEKALKEAKAAGRPVGERSVEIQRELFESVGIQQDHGVMQLNRMSMDYGRDRELVRAMMIFSNDCSKLVKKIDPDAVKKAEARQKARMEAMQRDMAERQRRMQQTANQQEKVVEGKVVKKAAADEAKAGGDTKADGKAKADAKGESDGKGKTETGKTEPTGSAGAEASNGTNQSPEDEEEMMLAMMLLEEEEKKKAAAQAAAGPKS